MRDELINRKALKQYIDPACNENKTKYHDTDQRALIYRVMDDIDEMTVAFDKEKVIEEIKEIVSDCYLEYCGKYNNCLQCSADEAVKIVEKGGVE